MKCFAATTAWFLVSVGYCVSLIAAGSSSATSACTRPARTASPPSHLTLDAV